MKKLKIQDFLIVKNVFVFDWDLGNRYKNEGKHNVVTLEAEEIFNDRPIYFRDRDHSLVEKRYLVYGSTKKGRQLVIIFTIRNKKVRVISARDQNKKERTVYQFNLD